MLVIYMLGIFCWLEKYFGRWAFTFFYLHSWYIGLTVFLVIAFISFLLFQLGWLHIIPNVYGIIHIPAMMFGYPRFSGNLVLCLFIPAFILHSYFIYGFVLMGNAVELWSFDYVVSFVAAELLFLLISFFIVQNGINISIEASKMK